MSRCAVSRPKPRTRNEEGWIGFGAKVIAPEDRKQGEIFRDVEPEDLLKYGLIPEFVGRLPVVATLEDLDEASLKLILTEHRNALLKQYWRLFEMEGVDLTVTDEALSAIARKAIERKTGARGLRTIIEAILLEPMFDLPSLEGVQQVMISEQVVEGSAEPLYMYAPAPVARERPNGAYAGWRSVERLTENKAKQHRRRKKCGIKVARSQVPRYRCLFAPTLPSRS